MALKFSRARKIPLPPDLREQEKEELRPLYHEKARRLGKITDEFKATVRAAKERKAAQFEEMLEWYNPQRDAIKEKYDLLAEERGRSEEHQDNQ